MPVALHLRLVFDCCLFAKTLISATHIYTARVRQETFFLCKHAQGAGRMSCSPDDVNHPGLAVRGAKLAPLLPRHGKARPVLAAGQVTPSPLDVHHA